MIVGRIYKLCLIHIGFEQPIAPAADGNDHGRSVARIKIQRYILPVKLFKLPRQALHAPLERLIG